MITDVTQRWRARRDLYRPAGEVIRTADYEVSEIANDGPVKAFIEANHYSGSFPAARWRFCLHRRGGELVGAAVFSHPINDRTLTRVFPGEATDSVELGRFVLLDTVAGNGETWFLAKCFRLLRDRVVGVISHSDPQPVEDDAGAVVFPGHIGTIYQAHNGVYLGRSSVDTRFVLPDGRILNRRSIQKLRKMERGWRYVVAQLVAAGAEAPPHDIMPADDLRQWFDTWLPRVTRRQRHPGNHRYAWAIDRAARGHLSRAAESAGRLPYPKFEAAA